MKSNPCNKITSNHACGTKPKINQNLGRYNGVDFDTLTVFCDNTSAINISKNLVQHSRTKHIDIRHHFIRELVENITLVLEYIEIEKQLANMFTKALDSVRFDSLRKSLGVCIM